MQPSTVNECRDQARAQRIPREQRKDFMQNCRRQVADACRNQTRTQNIRGDARRDFMRNCMGIQARAQSGPRRGQAYGVPPDDGEPMDDDDGVPPPAPPRQ
jgi:hypothetical protein